MGSPGGHDRELTRLQGVFFAVDPEAEHARQHLEALFLIRMDVFGGDEPTGRDEEIAPQELALRVPGYL